VIPLMVGISASAATFCLVFPQLIHNGVDVNPLFIAACPVIATAAAALGAAASVETLAQGLLALGERGPDRVLSVREATTPHLRKEVAMQRIVPISKSVLPAIVAGLLLPSAFVNKCIISSAISAVAAAYSFAEAEAVCGECLVKVANIAKASAKAEVLANDAKSQSAVLPFTSAVAGLALAAAAIVCEFNMAVAGWIPLVGAVAAGLSNQAAAKSRQDAADARLAFLDEKLRKMAKTDEIPDLTLKVMPPLLVNMGVAGGRILLNSIQDALDPEKAASKAAMASASVGGASSDAQSSSYTASSKPATLGAVSINVEGGSSSSPDTKTLQESATAVPPRKSKAERFLWGE